MGRIRIVGACVMAAAACTGGQGGSTSESLVIDPSLNIGAEAVVFGNGPHDCDVPGFFRAEAVGASEILITASNVRNCDSPSTIQLRFLVEGDTVLLGESSLYSPDLYDDTPDAEESYAIELVTLSEFDPDGVIAGRIGTEGQPFWARIGQDPVPGNADGEPLLSEGGVANVTLFVGQSVFASVECLITNVARPGYTTLNMSRGCDAPKLQILRSHDDSVVISYG